MRYVVVVLMIGGRDANGDEGSKPVISARGLAIPAKA